MNTQIANLPRLATVEKASEAFAEAGETPAAIRANIFKAADRFNSRGEKISGNGLAATGAIIRRGRKVLIDIDKYSAWLSGSANAAIATTSPLARDACKRRPEAQKRISSSNSRPESVAALKKRKRNSISHSNDVR